MRNTKYILSNFTFYDRTGIQAYLEAQAEKGWLLEKADTFLWRFRRVEPKKLHFAVVYFPGADVYDPEPGEEEQTFREFCAHGGWHIAASSAQMQIFYSEMENPMPIETDPVMEVENIHKSMRKGMLPSYWILILNGVIQLALQLTYLSDGVTTYLSSHLQMSLAGLWMLLLIIGVWRLIHYYAWRKQAKWMAEQEGVFEPTRSMARVELIVGCLVFGGLIAMVFTLEDRRMRVVLGISLILAFALIGLVEAFRRKLKREGYEAGANKTATTIAAVLLTIVLMIVVMPMISNAVLNDGHNDNDKAAELKLRIWDLVEDTQPYTTLVLTDQETFLLGYQQVYQVPEGVLMKPSLEYNVVEVKAKFLYDKCLEEMMTVPVYMTEGVFHSVDPTPWGAEDAWQLHDGEDMRSWYVLCYEDYILEIFPGWDITEEQMATVGEIFG